MTFQFAGVRPKDDHPAKFSPEIMDAIEVALFDHVGRALKMEGAYRPNGPVVLDPFGGPGGIHLLRYAGDSRTVTYDTFTVEIEPEWAAASARRGPSWCGNFMKLQLGQHGSLFEWGPTGTEHACRLFQVDAIVTSPTYGNRMADHHEAKDTSRRLTYRHVLGRPLHIQNSGALQWGREYRFFHERAWRKARKVLIEGGGRVLILNVKNHVRRGEVQDVVSWHKETLKRLGFQCVNDHRIPVKGMKYGENRDLRVPFEHVFTFRLVK